MERSWADEADVVVIGAGATGLPAAIAAAENGASVIILEANFDVGGHAAISGGNLALGGGTSLQKKYGVEDSPDLLFADLTDWSVVQPNGYPDYRYNDRELIRAYADFSAPTFEWLIEHGVVFVDMPVDNRGAASTGNSAPREAHIAAMDWAFYQTGRPLPEDRQAVTNSGIGLIRPLEAAARKLGVRILLKHRMTELIREPNGGRVTGVVCETEGRRLDIRARKGVIVGTGGSTSNVNFRRIFDPRLTEEYCGVAGEPFTAQDASGEIAAMAVGASLWGAANQSNEIGVVLAKAGLIGTRYGYGMLQWQPGSPVFDLARATGLRVRSWQDAILVNQLGKRFYDETAGQFDSNKYGDQKEYVPGSWRNSKSIIYNPPNFLNAALAGIGDGRNGGGPIWAIFDADACEREGWTPEPPYVDPDGFFFSADTIEMLAKKIENKYQRAPISPEVLAQTVARYNSFVDAGEDADFAKPSPQYRIEKPPFYAAWSTPVVHDTRVGLRIDAESRVIDLNGEVIPGLYCGGESAGGFSMHGLARCIVQGRIAGINAGRSPRLA